MMDAIGGNEKLKSPSTQSLLVQISLSKKLFEQEVGCESFRFTAVLDDDEGKYKGRGWDRPAD
jgi:hypothetical protein